MKKQTRYLISLFCLLLLGSSAIAQFGNKKKADIEKFKDSRLVVVLFSDSAYNAAIRFAVERYWNFNGAFLFAYDTALKAYSKGDYSFLIFSKAKGTKIKAKLCSAEPDFNGLLVLNKFKKRATELEIIGKAYCSNSIDTLDWQPELIRGVQLLNTYFSIAAEAKGDKEMSESFLQSRYPNDKGAMVGKKLLIEGSSLEVKGKVDAATLLDGEIEELENEEALQKSIVAQDAAVMHYFYSNDEKNCNKLVVTSDGQLMYFKQDSAGKCKCTENDLKQMKKLKDKSQIE
jgi:hypothetical protein